MLTFCFYTDPMSSNIWNVVCLLLRYSSILFYRSFSCISFLLLYLFKLSFKFISCNWISSSSISLFLFYNFALALLFGAIISETLGDLMISLLTKMSSASFWIYLYFLSYFYISLFYLGMLIWSYFFGLDKGRIAFSDSCKFLNWNFSEYLESTKATGFTSTSQLFRS